MKALWLILIFQTQLLAAPHPLTGSSIINLPSNSFAFSQMGFSLDSIPSNWIYNKADTASADVIEIGPTGKTLISFRLENVSMKTQLETYVRKYLRDYNQYGFEVISLQSYSKSHTPSVIVDLSQKNKNTKSRQVFFYRKNKMIIATCADQSDTYEKTVSLCNQILATFKWR